MRQATVRTLQRIMMPIATACAVALAACATTQLKEQWRDPDYVAASPQRVLVIAVMGRDERRRVFEDQFVARLRAANVEAVASYPDLSVAGREDLERVRCVVERSRATLVLSVRLLDMAQETRVSGGYDGRSGLYDFYPHASVGSYYPADVYTHRTFLTETRVFDMKRDKLVWTATMKTEEPSDFAAAASRYADLVVKQLQYNKLVVGR